MNCHMCRSQTIMLLLLPLLLLAAADDCSAALQHYDDEAAARAAIIHETTLFVETFSSKAWDVRWEATKAPKYTGIWTVGQGHQHDVIKQQRNQQKGKEQQQNTNNAPLPPHRALLLTTASRRGAISAMLPTPFNMAFADMLVLQYQVRMHHELECGGAYIKLIGSTAQHESLEHFRPEAFNAETPYGIMFGPDVCGDNNRVHFIFRHKSPTTGKYTEHHLRAPPNAPIDTETHLYRLVVNVEESTFEVAIDGQTVRHGSLLTEFEPPVRPPSMIDDPSDTKPDTWVDEKKIPDPHAVKPQEWDETQPPTIPNLDVEMPEDWDEAAPLRIPDPSLSQPEDWDEESDGPWTAPLVDNPECDDHGCGMWFQPVKPNPLYKGPWKAPLIDNPAYVGEWKPRQMPNPAVFDDAAPFRSLPTIYGVGFELWTMQSDLEFDNIFIGREVATAEKFADRTWKVKHEREVAQRVVVVPTWADWVHTGMDVLTMWMATHTRWAMLILGAVVTLCIFSITHCCSRWCDDMGEAKSQAYYDEAEKHRASLARHLPGHVGAGEATRTNHNNTDDGGAQRSKKVHREGASTATSLPQEVQGGDDAAAAAAAAVVEEASIGTCNARAGMPHLRVANGSTCEACGMVLDEANGRHVDAPPVLGSAAGHAAMSPVVEEAEVVSAEAGVCPARAGMPHKLVVDGTCVACGQIITATPPAEHVIEESVRGQQQEEGSVIQRPASELRYRKNKKRRKA